MDDVAQIEGMDEDPRVSFTSRPIAAVLTLPRTIFTHWELVKAMTSRTLRGRFRGSALGMLWPLIHPFCLFWVYLFLFSRILGVMRDTSPESVGLQDVVSAELVGKYYFAVYLFSGILMWSFFAETVQRNVASIITNANLIKKMAFPSEIIPFSEVVAEGFLQVFGICVFLGFMFIGGFWPPPTIQQVLVFPVLLILQMVFTYGVSLVVATLNVFLRDTAHILGVFLIFWMFLTPIFWAPEMLEHAAERKHSSVQWVLELLSFNPMFHLLKAYRNVLIHPGLDWSTWEQWQGVCIFAVFAVVMVWLGMWFFCSHRCRFADEV